MPRYYCDYCDTYLTHDSPSVRKQHNAGYKHKANVRTYYQQFEEQQTQSLIDQRIKEHLGQAAAFQHQVGATFHQHLASLPHQRPRLPILPTPILPVPGSSQGPGNSPLVPGIRPPVLPRPIPGTPGYMATPTVPQVMVPPGAASLAMQMNSLPRPPTLTPPATVGTTVPTSNGPTTMNPAVYQAGPTIGGPNAYNSSAAGPQGSASGGPAAPASVPQDGFTYSQSSETNY